MGLSGDVSSVATSYEWFVSGWGHTDLKSYVGFRLFRWRTKELETTDFTNLYVHIKSSVSIKFESFYDIYWIVSITRVLKYLSSCNVVVVSHSYPNNRLITLFIVLASGISLMRPGLNIFTEQMHSCNKNIVIIVLT